MDKGLTINQFMDILDKKRQLYKDTSYQLFCELTDNDTPQEDYMRIIMKQQMIEMKMETIEEIETALFDTIDRIERG